jgi:hypothetical protein
MPSQRKPSSNPAAVSTVAGASYDLRYIEAIERIAEGLAALAIAVERHGDTLAEAIEHHASITAAGSTDE